MTGFLNEIGQKINDGIAYLQKYISSLPQDQLYAHYAVALGVVLVIVSILIW